MVARFWLADPKPVLTCFRHDRAGGQARLLRHHAAVVAAREGQVHRAPLRQRIHDEGVPQRRNPQVALQ